MRACRTSVERRIDFRSYIELHRSLLRRFPYGVFFTADEQVVRVVACLHVRRDPKTWSERLRRDR